MKKLINTIIEELGTIKRAARREFYLQFRKGYVARQLKERKGKCGRHGCCNLSVFHTFRTCFDKKNPAKCLRWEHLPYRCRVYPFDEQDKIPKTRAYCNFYWEKKPLTKSNKQDNKQKRAKLR